jgi:uncharacterized protein (TIGR02186 family)
MRASVRCLAFCAMLALAAPGAPAAADERLEADVSTREIAVQSTFTGVRIVVFGAVDNSRQTGPDDGLYDIAVVVRGPEESLVARRKSWFAGIWVNAESRRFESVPGYYAVLTTRPVEEIARSEVLDAHGIGFDSLRFMRDDTALGPRDMQEPFRDAVIRIMGREGLYVIDGQGVSFVGTTLFRATAYLPANVPVGEFTVDVYLFRDGELLSRHTSGFSLFKEGVERAVTVMAYDYPLLYGIAAVLLAIAAGLAASAAFRRD